MPIHARTHSSLTNWTKRKASKQPEKTTSHRWERNEREKKEGKKIIINVFYTVNINYIHRSTGFDAIRVRDERVRIHTFCFWHRNQRNAHANRSMDGLMDVSRTHTTQRVIFLFILSRINVFFWSIHMIFTACCGHRRNNFNFCLLVLAHVDIFVLYFVFMANGM